MAMLKTQPDERDHRRGDPNASVVLVEYGDFQCPYCAEAEPVVRALLGSFGDLQQVYRHFQLTEVHPLADIAAQAAEFAGAEGAFWPMHDALFANQPQLSVPVIFAIAGQLGLPQVALRDALEARTYAGRVHEDFIGGVRSGVNGTPCFFVNGVRHEGPFTFEALAGAIIAAQASASDAGRPPPHRPATPHQPRSSP
jgi:protein-disulfide isomerase